MHRPIKIQSADNRAAMAIQIIGKITHTLAAQTEGDGSFNAIDMYRRHRGLEAAAPVNAFISWQDGPHDRQLTRKIVALFENVVPTRTFLIYIHRGYQPNYRTPMLQSLLAGLPKLGGVSSLRARTQEMPHEIHVLLKAHLTCFDHVLVVNDQHDRLSFGPETSREAIVEFTLIDRNKQPASQSPIHIQTGPLLEENNFPAHVAPPLPPDLANPGTSLTTSGAS